MSSSDRADVFCRQFKYGVCSLGAKWNTQVEYGQVDYLLFQTFDALNSDQNSLSSFRPSRIRFFTNLVRDEPKKIVEEWPSTQIQSRLSLLSLGRRTLL